MYLLQTLPAKYNIFWWVEWRILYILCTCTQVDLMYICMYLYTNCLMYICMYLYTGCLSFFLPLGNYIRVVCCYLTITTLISIIWGLCVVTWQSLLYINRCLVRPHMWSGKSLQRQLLLRSQQLKELLAPSLVARCHLIKGTFI